MSKIKRVTNDELHKILKPKRAFPRKDDRAVIWRDDWRKQDRILYWQGPCLGCEIQTWSFYDGDNDPRGALGDSASWPIDFPDVEPEIEVRCCALCANDERLYNLARNRAKRVGVAKSRPYAYQSPTS